MGARSISSSKGISQNIRIAENKLKPKKTRQIENGFPPNLQDAMNTPHYKTPKG